MILLVCNILLALVWASTIGMFTIPNFAAGFALGYLALWLAVGKHKDATYFHHVAAGLRLLAYFVHELIKANVQMVRISLGPIAPLRPAILAIPLKEGLTDMEITTLANMITLTPGTLSLDISADRRALFVHFMHVEDPQRQIEEITDGFERRLLEATRCAA